MIDKIYHAILTITFPLGGYLALACIVYDWYSTRKRKRHSDKVVKEILQDIDNFERRMGWKK